MPVGGTGHLRINGRSEASRQERATGVPLAGLLLYDKFGRDAAVTFSYDTQIPVLIRAKANTTVHVEGESLTLDAMGKQFPPERCRLYAEFGWRVCRLRALREVVMLQG